MRFRDLGLEASFKGSYTVTMGLGFGAFRGV